MLIPRIIPCLLVHNKGLVKTVKFKDPKYVGDPINAVKIFNEKEVDEIIVLDIDATVERREPDYKMIENLATECRMPLCYGGGVKTVEQAQRIFSLGVEKVALSSAAVENPALISDVAKIVGKQSVVVVLDVKKKTLGNKYEVYINNAKMNTGINPINYAQQLEELGVGEIVLNSIENDGTLKGYDLNIAKKVREVISVPMTIIGGAGSFNHIGELINHFGIIGAGAGSIFVFKGKYRAVLINYPNRLEKEKLFQNYYNEMKK